MVNRVFIHTNDKQLLGALVARYALTRNTAAPERFEVRILRAEEAGFLTARDGQSYLREGKPAVWRSDDLQSFTPLRFSVPEAMGYEGRAVVIDPDIFALGDINELLDRDMGGAAVLARRMAAGHRRPLHYASSVMLLDCARLRHWQVDRDFGALFAFERDYRDWMWLLLEPAGSVGPLEAEWNDFDRLTPDTRLLHNTHRRTQPWKTGLPADFTPRGTTFSSRAGIALRRLRGVFGGHAAGHYQPHPDAAQERLFFQLLGECLDKGLIGEDLVRAEMARRNLRPDALRLVERHAA